MPNRRDPSLDLSRREAAAVIAGVCAAGLSACGRIRSRRVSLHPGRTPVITPATPRVDAIPGAPLLFPVTVEGPMPGSLRPALSLSDGRVVESELVWIGIEQDAAAAASWLPAVATWVVAPVDSGAIPASVGSWHLSCMLPSDAGGQALSLGERRVPVNWLAAPGALRPSDAESGWAPWRRPQGAPAPSAELLAPEWRSPLRRWRARLATSGLDAPHQVAGIWPVRGEGDALDDLADLVEGRWRAALARLWYADADACDSVLRCLTRTVELSPGRHVPAWPADQASLDALLGDLLDPGLDAGSVVARAEAWTRTLPRSAVWIEDDAAWLREGRIGATIGAASLRDEPVLLWVTGRGGLRTDDPQPLLPAQTLRLSVEVGAGEAVTGAREFSVYRGDEVTRLFAREPVPVRPPGARCGPLLHDWSLEAWSTNRVSAGAARDPAWATAALLLRDETGVSPSGWSLYLECARGEGGSGSGDSVQLWFGPRGDARAILAVGADGSVTSETDPDGQTLLPVMESAGRWAVSVPVPEAAVEPGGIVRIGITRVDGAGLRTAWPRRLMPWEREPARCAFGLTGWEGRAASGAGG